MNNAFIKLKLNKENQLIPINEEEGRKFLLYKKGLPVDSEVEGYFSLTTVADKTLGQLAKVHSLIKIIADESGNDQEDVKHEIKRKAGLFSISETSSPIFKSFKDCTKQELSKAIECCIELGTMLGYKVS
jgi:hypothetical protein